MATMEQLRTPGAPRSANEINRRVRRIERDRYLSGLTPRSQWGPDGDAWGNGAMMRENAQTNSVPIATVSQDRRIALTVGGIEIRREGKPVESTSLRGGSRWTVEQPTSAGLVTPERMLDVREGLNGGAPAQRNGQVVYNDGVGPTTAMGHTQSSSGRHRGKSALPRAAAGAFPKAAGEAQLVTPRGRQRMPKPWLMAVLCRLGMHEGLWAYVAEGNCTLGRECERCESVHVRTKHQREWRYVADAACGQLKVCKRCLAPNGSRTRHQAWSTEWDVGDERAHRCLRCGVVEKWSTADSD